VVKKKKTEQALKMDNWEAINDNSGMSRNVKEERVSKKYKKLILKA